MKQTVQFSTLYILRVPR